MLNKHAMQTACSTHCVALKCTQLEKPSLPIVPFKEAFSSPPPPLSLSSGDSSIMPLICCCRNERCRRLARRRRRRRWFEGARATSRGHLRHKLTADAWSHHPLRNTGTDYSGDLYSQHLNHKLLLVHKSCYSDCCISLNDRLGDRLRHWNNEILSGI